MQAQEQLHFLCIFSMSSTSRQLPSFRFSRGQGTRLCSYAYILQTPGDIFQSLLRTEFLNSILLYLKVLLLISFRLSNRVPYAYLANDPGSLRYLFRNYIVLEWVILFPNTETRRKKQVSDTWIQDSLL